VVRIGPNLFRSHWFEPSTAHLTKGPLDGLSVFSEANAKIASKLTDAGFGT